MVNIIVWKYFLKTILFFSYQHSFYSKLLRLYLESKYNNLLTADKKYLNLVKLVSTMETLKENERKLHQEIDFHQIPHIIVEMYNLNL